MAKKKPSAIADAWEDLVFRPIPWTTEERLRRWRPLFEQTWNSGSPVGDLDDAKLVITAGWGLFAELGDWNNALDLALMARQLIGKLEDEHQTDYLISLAGWAYLYLDKDLELYQNVHEILDLKHPNRRSPLHFASSLVLERLQTRPSNTLVSEDLREVVSRLLIAEKKSAATRTSETAHSYKELLEVVS